MKNNDSIVITSIARTPQGNLLGALKELSAPQLGTAVIRAVCERAQLKHDLIQEVIMGCVLPAGQGQAPARQASLEANLSMHTSCTTINKMCGSGMKAIMLAHDILLASDRTIMIAGGMESMTNAPYLLSKARQGYRLGHGTLIDHMMMDGLEDAYEKGQPMGYFAELCAREYHFTREEQDAFATRSLSLAQQTDFSTEIVPLAGLDKDEHPFSVKIEKIPTLRPIYMKDGTITAANSCSIADGAAAVSLMRLSTAEKHGITPLARIIAHSCYSNTPAAFPTAPISAIKNLLEKIKWTIDDVDLFEINEAFSVVPLAVMRDLSIPLEKINIHGGGCALGHPIGATGARIIVTLLSALQKHRLKRGIASLCIGGGEATAIAFERYE